MFPKSFSDKFWTFSSRGAQGLWLQYFCIYQHSVLLSLLLIKHYLIYNVSSLILNLKPKQPFQVWSKLICTKYLPFLFLSILFFLCHFWSEQVCCFGTEEKTQQLITLVPLTGDLGSDPSIHMVLHIQH